jgi:hypothetical protein
MWSTKIKCGFDTFCTEYTFEFRVVSQNDVTHHVNFAKLRESSHNYLMTNHKKCEVSHCNGKYRI